MVQLRSNIKKLIRLLFHLCSQTKCSVSSKTLRQKLFLRSLRFNPRCFVLSINCPVFQLVKWRLVFIYKVHPWPVSGVLRHSRAQLMTVVYLLLPL